MAILHPGLFSVMQRFPDDRKALRRLYLTSDSFQTLCDDYRRCARALAYWSSCDHGHAPDMCREYGELKTSLELEIEDVLDQAALLERHGWDRRE